MYAVDASNMADHARALVGSNGLDGVITVIKGKVEDIDLPEKVQTILLLMTCSLSHSISLCHRVQHDNGIVETGALANHVLMTV